MPRPDPEPYPGVPVSVVVDRPLGAVHPEYPDLRYAVTYGHLPGTVGGDGEPVDYCILGVNEPVREASGLVIGVELRAHGVEDTLSVAPDGVRLTVDEMRDLVDVQGRLF